MNKVLVNADDFGLSREVNDAIVYSFIHHLIDRTTLMVNMPYCNEAIKKAQEFGFEDKIGLHINIVEGKPLTEPIKNTILCNQYGNFDGNVMKKTFNRLYFGNKEKSAIEIEIEAQIEKFLNFNIGQKHMDSHRHAHVAPSVFPIIVDKYKKYGFQSMRLARNIPENEIGVLKRKVKDYINNQIISLNNDNIRMFGSMKDVEKEIRMKGTKGDIELMVHPVIYNGKLCDAIEAKSLEEWLKENEDCIRSITL